MGNQIAAQCADIVPDPTKNIRKFGMNSYEIALCTTCFSPRDIETADALIDDLHETQATAKFGIAIGTWKLRIRMVAKRLAIYSTMKRTEIVANLITQKYENGIAHAIRPFAPCNQGSSVKLPNPVFCDKCFYVREAAVAQLRFRGIKTQQIAQSLGLTKNVTKQKIHALLELFDCSSSEDMSLSILRSHYEDGIVHAVVPKPMSQCTATAGMYTIDDTVNARTYYRPNVVRVEGQTEMFPWFVR